MKYEIDLYADPIAVPAGQPIACPTCGGAPIATLETAAYKQYVQLDPATNTMKYTSGRDEDDLNNGSTTVEVAGLPVLVCEDDHYFTHGDVRTRDIA